MNLVFKSGDAERLLIQCEIVALLTGLDTCAADLFQKGREKNGTFSEIVNMQGDAPRRIACFSLRLSDVSAIDCEAGAGDAG
jgi:hypothetical protein